MQHTQQVFPEINPIINESLQPTKQDCLENLIKLKLKPATNQTGIPKNVNQNKFEKKSATNQTEVPKNVNEI